MLIAVCILYIDTPLFVGVPSLLPVGQVVLLFRNKIPFLKICFIYIYNIMTQVMGMLILGYRILSTRCFYVLLTILKKTAIVFINNTDLSSNVHSLCYLWRTNKTFIYTVNKFWSLKVEGFLSRSCRGCALCIAEISYFKQALANVRHWSPRADYRSVFVHRFSMLAVFASSRQADWSFTN
jgi:hypothetical protein